MYPEPDRSTPPGAPNTALVRLRARYCIGASLARVELKAVFAALPRRLPGLHLAVPVQELRLRTDVFTGGLEALPVAWRPDRGDRRVAGAPVAPGRRGNPRGRLVGTVYGVLVTEPSAGWRGVPELGYGC